MAGVFLIETGRRKSSNMEFRPEVEEEGIKFNMENAAEDIINGLFCTYEPPTSKAEQYWAANQFREDPKKYAFRPHVPKSILKRKIKKHNPNKTRGGDAPSTAPDDAPATTPDEAAPSAIKETNKETSSAVVVTKKKNVTWRDERGKVERTKIENKVVDFSTKYCGGACNSGEDIADILSSPTGRAAQNFFVGGPETPGSMASIPGSMASMASSVFGKSPKSADTSNAKILYDDQGNPIQEEDTGSEVGSYFPTTPASAAPTPKETKPINPKLVGRSNLFCSNIPFADTVKEGFGIAGVMAATAAVAAGVPDTLCGQTMIRRATCSETSIVPVSREEQEEISEELKQAKQAQEELGVYEPENYDNPTSSSIKMKRQSTPRHVRTPDVEVPDDETATTQQKQPTPHPAKKGMSSERSYANSDITMGNTTIKHFRDNGSVFDNVESAPVTPKSPMKFSSLVEELKHVQIQKGLEGSSQHGIVSSRKEEYMKSATSQKHDVATKSYVNSLKSPASGRSESLDKIQTGTVSSLAMQFENARARTNQDAVRKSIDPTECRQFDGKRNFLPPTPRRKKQPSSAMGEKLNIFDNPQLRQDETQEKMTSATSVNTEAEIREAASSIVDVTRPSFVGRRQVEKPNKTADPTEEREDQSDPPEDREDQPTKNIKKDKKKKEKKPKKGLFGRKFKSFTKKFEDERIYDGEDIGYI